MTRIPLSDKKRAAPRVSKGGVTAPRGFLAAGVHAGIKKPQVPDLALVVSQQDAAVAGLFTTNRVTAAPVLLDRRHLRYGRARAIVVLSVSARRRDRRRRDQA